MSNLYNLEPQPTAKVLLLTTAGDLELELFAKQIPLASRNFLQLCLDGYYNGTIFHRLVPGFVLQGGDPTGTGSGGESSFEDGKPFADEFHSRIKFNRRGLLGMANTGKKDDNGSQFFLTLGETPELTGKNTMFGRVVGDTIYNLMKMADADMAEEGGDRPLYPYKITGTEILINPFEDMVKRDLNKRAVAPEKKEKKKPKRKAGKALLSFGGDDEGEDVAPLVKKPKFNPKLVSVADDELSVPSKPAPKAPETKPAERPAPKPRKPASPSPPPKRDQILASMISHQSKPTKQPSPTSSRSSSPSTSPEPTRNTELISKTNAQIAELKASMRRTGPQVAEAPKKKSALEAMIPETSTRGRKRRPGITNQNKDEQDVLSMFKAFKEKLEQLPPTDEASSEAPEEPHSNNAPHAPAPAEEEDEEAALCDLHFIINCQSCSRWDADGNLIDSGNAEDDKDDDLDGTAWMKHKLTFAKDRLGKDLEWKRKNEEELVVIDPREKARELGVEKGKGKGKGRERDAERERLRVGGGGREWDKERKY
jgi:peptidyl-prolyl cis-trans isomerase SDCCAG10